MKRQIVVSAMVAFIISISTIGSYIYLKPDYKKVQIEHINTTPSSKTLYSIDENGSFTPLDFRETAEMVLDGVVHIKSTHLYRGNSGSFEPRGYSNPFKDFFNDDLEKFFGPGFQFNSPRQAPQKPQSRVGSGSGVIISDDGYIVTNNHVIAEADDIEITLHDNRTFKAKVIGTDPSTDLALLQIKAKSLPVIPLINSDDVHNGQWVLAIGNPMGLNSTVTAGIISAKGRNLNINNDKYAVENFIQTDAAINPGNSGGALVNLQGGLVGINTAIASPTGSFAGYGFAVPSNIVEKVVEDLLKYGVVQRGVLGIMIRTMDGNLAKEKDLDITKGVLVDSIFENSAAGKAGVKAGDVIVAINGTDVSTSAELQGIIAQHRPGEKVDVTILRTKEELTLDVILNNRNGNTTLTAKENQEILKVLGADFQTLDAKKAKYLDIKGGVQIKKIYVGRLRKYTQINEGFIITHVDGQEVKNVDELVDLLDQKNGGILIEGIYEDIPGVYYYAIGLDG